jgi:hypothetical protein
MRRKGAHKAGKLAKPYGWLMAAGAVFPVNFPDKETIFFNPLTRQGMPFHRRLA